MVGVKGTGQGNTNAALPPGQGKRLKLDLSLSKERRVFFEQVTRDQGKILTDQEIINTARRWYYEQDEKAREIKMTTVTTKAIAIGSIEDDAKEWLIKHGATVEESDVIIIRLPNEARVLLGSHARSYTIEFYGDEKQYCHVALDINIYETIVRLGQNGY